MYLFYYIHIFSTFILDTTPILVLSTVTMPLERERVHNLFGNTRKKEAVVQRVLEVGAKSAYVNSLLKELVMGFWVTATPN